MRTPKRKSICTDPTCSLLLFFIFLFDLFLTCCFDFYFPSGWLFWRWFAFFFFKIVRVVLQFCFPMFYCFRPFCDAVVRTFFRAVAFTCFDLLLTFHFFWLLLFNLMFVNQRFWPYNMKCTINNVNPTLSISKVVIFKCNFP